MPLTSSHWGTYNAVVKQGRLVDMAPFAEDADPSAIGRGLVGVVDGPTRITAPMVRKGWLEGRSGRRGSDRFVEVSWAVAEQLVADELARVQAERGNQGIFAGCYGWASAGRFHHAQSQIHRFMNCIGGYVKSVNTYSFAAAEVIIPHVLGDFRGFIYDQTSWQSICDEGALFVGFGGLPLKNAQINHGLDDFKLTQNDLEVHETFFQSQTNTVLMIDISHSMILYGEDRITPAKKVAMALSELITTRYPKDSLDVLVFGNDAWQIEIKDLPYLEVGPYHTNTVAGLELAMNILRRRKNPNKQIMMITDGKPTCIKKGKKYYKNAFGLDRTILNRTLSLAVKARKLNIPITTFMIARDPYLVQFVDKFTRANNGKAFYSSLQGLGEFIFMDYKDNKRRKKG